MKKKGDKTGVLKSWIGLNNYLKTATEKEVLGLLEHERQNKQRPSFLTRLQRRYNSLRGKRELNTVLGEVK